MPYVFLFLFRFTTEPAIYFTAHNIHNIILVRSARFLTILPKRKARPFCNRIHFLISSFFFFLISSSYFLFIYVDGEWRFSSRSPFPTIFSCAIIVFIVAIGDVANATGELSSHLNPRVLCSLIV